MEISVVVCTRNRAVQLAEFLRSITAIDVPEGLAWEMIIVDNGSTDDTAAVIESFKDRLPIQRIFQGIPGLSNARNSGVDAARGKYIVWTDDDVVVDSHWLAGFRDAFRRWPDAAVFGGKIVADLQPPTPGWFIRAREDVASLLAVRDFGDQPVPLSSQLLPYGACYAIRAAEQKKHKYNPELGVAPGRRMGGEEVEVMRAILQAGGTGWWFPESKVIHVVPSARQSMSYIFEYYAAYGEYFAYDTARKNKRTTLFGVRLGLWLRLPYAFVLYHVRRMLGSQKCMASFVYYATKWGEFQGWRHPRVQALRLRLAHGAN